MKFPVLLLPAKSDPSTYHRGGEVFEAMHNNNHATETYTFSDMVHGWVPRGDLSDPLVERDVAAALDKMRSFFALH